MWVFKILPLFPLNIFVRSKSKLIRLDLLVCQDNCCTWWVILILLTNQQQLSHEKINAKVDYVF